MAEQQRNTQVPIQETIGETKDRGMFGFMGKKEEEKKQQHHHQPQENISSELGQKAQVSEENKPGLMEKLRRSDNSSSSDEEVEGEGGQKIRRKKEKKGLAANIKKPVHEDFGNAAGDKEGKAEKIKEKLTGHEKKEDHMPYAVEGREGEDKENKGMLGKIKEKIPGMHSKTEDAKKDCEKEPGSY